MPQKFRPNARELLLIEEAKRRLERDHGTGHHPPAELVARMTLEGLLTDSPDDDSSRVEESGCKQTEEVNSVRPGALEASREVDEGACRVVLAVAVVVDEALAKAEIKPKGAMSNCVSATVFKVPRHVVLLEFNQPVSHRDAAMVASVEEVLRAFPRAEFIDLNDQNALVEELVEASREMAPDQQQLETMYRCTMPADDVIALAAAAIDGFLSQRNAGARPVEAEVFEVHLDFGIAHLTTPDGRMVCVTERTPGIASLSQLQDGQRYRCWVQGRCNLVVRAELTG